MFSEKKYLKYKNKYYNLKRQKGGATPEELANRSTAFVDIDRKMRAELHQLFNTTSVFYNSGSVIPHLYNTYKHPLSAITTSEQVSTVLCEAYAFHCGFPDRPDAGPESIHSLTVVLTPDAGPNTNNDTIKNATNAFILLYNNTYNSMSGYKSIIDKEFEESDDDYTFKFGKFGTNMKFPQGDHDRFKAKFNKMIDAYKMCPVKIHDVNTDGTYAVALISTDINDKKYYGWTGFKNIQAIGKITGNQVFKEKLKAGITHHKIVPYIYDDSKLD